MNNQTMTTSGSKPIDLENDVQRLDNCFALQPDEEIARFIIYLLEGKSLKVLDLVQGSLDDFRGVQKELIEYGLVKHESAEG